MCPSSLYIHIPFCNRKCLFCSFVIAVAQEHRREEYVSALVREMKKNKDQSIATVYFGGGTPSMLEEGQLNRLMEAIGKNFILEDDAEITIEVNPESIDRSKARFLKDQGINRVSLGVQSLNDRYLKFLGRSHGARGARDAYHWLREAGIANVNLDLMYAFPGQTREELTEDVRQIAALGSEHLSLYTLTIEPNSRFFMTQMKLDDDDILADHYLFIAKLLGEYGFGQYEISNFAKPGFESRHNKNYWLGTPYIGLGVGAHGFTGRRRYWNTSKFKEYLEHALKGTDALEGYEDLTDAQLNMERVLFGLRMNEGIVANLIPSDKQGLINTWVNDGFLWQGEGKLKATDRGRLVLDELSSRLI